MAVAVLIVLCVLVTTARVSSEGYFDQQVAFFAFGDSHFDNGNNNFINTTPRYQANFWPYGKSYFYSPTGRFNNGRIIPDFIAEFAGLPMLPAYLKPGNSDFVNGAIFASGGAGALVESHAGSVVSLRQQVRYFGEVEKQLRQDLGDAKTKQLISNAVYLFSCGSNDYFSPIGNPDSLFYSYTIDQYVDMVIGNFTDLIKEIYQKGGRKFGFVPVPPVTCWPSIRALQPNNTCSKPLEVLTTLHNQKLSRSLNALEKQLKGFKYAKFDLFTAFTNRMKNPSRYGFREGQTACCGSGPFRGNYTCGRAETYELCKDVDGHLFFDANHANEVAARQYATLFWNGSPKVTGPYNLKALFKPTPRTIRLPRRLKLNPKKIIEFIAKGI